MSATVGLYRPLKREQIIETCCPIWESTEFIKIENLPKYIADANEREASIRDGLAIVDDWIEHEDRLDILYIPCNHKQFRRSNRIKRYRERFKQFYNASYANCPIVVCECVDAMYGWFFSKKLMNASFPFFYAFTKDEARRTAVKFIDIRDCTAEDSQRIWKSIEEMIDKFQDGDIMEFSW